MTLGSARALKGNCLAQPRTPCACTLNAAVHPTPSCLPDRKVTLTILRPISDFPEGPHPPHTYFCRRTWLTKTNKFGVLAAADLPPIPVEPDDVEEPPADAPRADATPPAEETTAPAPEAAPADGAPKKQRVTVADCWRVIQAQKLQIDELTDAVGWERKRVSDLAQQVEELRGGAGGSFDPTPMSDYYRPRRSPPDTDPNLEARSR